MNYLIKCIRSDFNPAIFKQLSTYDWSKIIWLSNQYNITAIIYQQLRRSRPTIVIPTDIEQELKWAYIRNFIRNQILFNELSRVLSVLSENNIPIIVLKGAYLASNIYEDIALRTMGDVDILVKKTDLPKVEEKLLGIGFVSAIENRIGVKERELTYIIRGGTNERVVIEVHWHIDSPTSPFNIDIDGLWERAQPTKIAGITVLVLSPVDQLLHLCLHSAYDHCFSHGLRSLYDIFKVIVHYQNSIDWVWVLYYARQWKCSNCVYLTLYLVKELLVADIPSKLLSDLKPPNFNEHIIVLAKKQIFTQDLVQDNKIVGTLPLLKRMKTLFFKFHGKVFINKTMGNLMQIFPSPRIMAQIYHLPLGSILIYPYYLVRIKVLLRRVKSIMLTYGYKIWHLLCNDEESTKLTEKYALKKWLEQEDNAK